MYENSLKVTVEDGLTDCGLIDTINKINMHKYLMKKHNIK